ncbi:MAG: outer membrane protein transport protein [Syntrophaceae bacterium]
MKKIISNMLCCLLLGAILTAGPAWAGGIMLYQIGTPDVGLAAAGYAARAQDASTVFTNPAGMGRLEKSQFLGGMQALYGDVKFSPDSATTTSGTDGGTAVGLVPGGSLFITQKINESWSFGFGALSYFGMSQGYDDNWVGRYYVQKSTILGETLMPAVSCKVNSWLYLGAGLNMMYGYLSDQAAVNNAGENRPDGQLKYRDREWGYGGNFGILVEPREGTRFGLTYLTEVNLDFAATPEFSGLGPVLEAFLRSQGLTASKMNLGMTVPQMVMFSGYHELNAKWAVMGNVGWQDWSRFGKVDVSVDSSTPVSLTADSNYKDTWHAALGVQYKSSPSWTLSFGVAYDSSAVDDDKRTVSVPMGEIWGIAAGAQYAVGPNLAIGAAYQLGWLGDMPVNERRGPLAGRVSGEFENSSFSFFALNVKWTY